MPADASRVGHLLLDASVLVELVIAGRHRASADRVLDQIRDDGDLVIVTAAHGMVEAASAIRRLVRAGALDAEQGSAAVRWLSTFDVVLDPTSPRLHAIWRLRDTMTAYDAAYAAAADALGLPLITTDERLRRACLSAGIACSHLDEAFAD
ncbi:type II toxin-antitoxin system VapC family toxin [Patulibacter sp.]|uniref:type II toxin-antitoxin system VapC family toxin n=1 Tax=Patulibacter sp. TaxID=1912859 RepID=UPI0027197CB2|nr:type II toxin-antitoxin system VapC family toxin [Patulibacter sp.]MDO9410108.1 type II toxin-antitoxin system VapC family toxin [Patulibacter sp.]